MSQIYFEDFEIGRTWNLGTYEMTRDEIVGFAKQYDPQPFHLDEAAAEESVFGEIVASGWHTATVYIRLLTVDFLEGTSHLAGKKIPELVWPAPVRPGDELSGTVEVIDKTVAEHRPDWGYLDYRVVGTNQDSETVLRMDLHGVFERRTEGGAT